MNDNEIEQFKELVVEWVKLDDIIRKRNAEMKEIKDDKKSIEEYILECMNKLDNGTIDISDGKLRLNKTKTKSGLKQAGIQEALTELTKDDLKAQEMTQYILDKRPVIERMNLKRTFNRSKKE